MTYPPAPPGSPDPSGAGVDPTRPMPVPGAVAHGGQAPPPTGAAVAPTPSSPSRPSRAGRILGRALVVLLVVGALGATTAWGFVNRASAQQWRDRSEAADEDLETALERIEAAEGDLDDARVRLRELANEKAGETDRNRILSEVVAQAPEVTDALADCHRRTADLANDIIALLRTPDADLSVLQGRTTAVNSACADALARAEDLEATIEALGA